MSTAWICNICSFASYGGRTWDRENARQASSGLPIREATAAFLHPE